MRKLLLFVLVLLCFIIPLRAQDAPLTTLAAYVPAESPFYFVIRTDALTTLDRLFDVIQEAAPDSLPPDFDLEEGLDSLADDIEPGGDFESVFGTWLGDSVAIAAPSTAMFDAGTYAESQPVVLFAVKDRQAAESFIDSLNIELTKTEEGDYTVYTASSEFTAEYVVGDDVMMITYSREYIDQIVGGDFAALEGVAAFGETLALLPGDDYGMALYLDTAALIGTMEDVDVEPQIRDALVKVIGQQAWGFALLDHRNLVLDVVAHTDESFALHAGSALDPAFAGLIPGDAQFVVHGSNIGQRVEVAITALSGLGEIYKNQMRAQLSGIPQMEASLASLDQIDFGGMTFGSTSLLFAGLTGLNLKDDVLSWMTGDFAGFASLIPVESELSLSLDAGFVTTATDPDAAASVVTGVTEAASAYGLASFTEPVGESEVLVMPTLLRSPFAYVSGFPDAWFEDVPELDVMLGSNADIFAAGTRSAVENALNPSGEMLADNAIYRYAADNVMLSGAQNTAYVNFDSLVTVINRSRFGDTPQMRNTLRLLSLFDSASVSAVITEPNVATARFAVTLAEPLNE